MKATSYDYGTEYQENMINHYKLQTVEDHYNHAYLRIELIKNLVNEAYNELPKKSRKDTTIVDIGCSIGGSSIPISKMGFSVYGLDFDPEAISIAKRLNEEAGTEAKFIEMDVSDWKDEFPPIDIALSADLFEHLHDDEIGGLLAGIKNNMHKDSILVFYTVPQEYDYIFWRKKQGKGGMVMPWFLFPFLWLNDKWFTRIVRTVALSYDIYSVLIRGQTFKERIKRADHPNPLTKQRLVDIFKRMGFDVLNIESSTMEIPEQMNMRYIKYFRKFSITHRMLYGMAKLK